MSISFDPKYIRFSTLGGSTLSDGLVAYWKMDEASGDAIDAKSTNDGTVIGTPTRNGAGIKQGYTFSDVEIQEVTIPQTAELMSAKMSISGWINIPISSTGNYAIYACMDNVVPYGFFVLIQSGQIFVGFGETSGNYTQATTVATVNTGQWIHFAVVVDGVDVRIYLNGTLQSLVQGGTSQPFAYDIDYIVDQPFSIAFSNGWEYHMVGSIDEIAQWNRALTPTEVTELYNSGNGITYPF